jgi:HK97 family phage major capsid protein
MTPIVRLRADERGAAFTKFLTCMVHGNGSEANALRVAEEHCASQPTVAATLRTKTAVGAQTTATGFNAYGIGTEVFQLLQTASIFGRLSTLCRRVPFKVKTPRETGAGVGAAWRGEGLPTPLVKSTFDNLTQEYFEAAAIIVASRESFRFEPIAEATLRDTVVKGLARFVDAQLLDPSITASSVRPGSLTSVAAAITSSGSTAANILADLDSLLSAIEVCENPVWCMRPKTFARVLGKLAGVGVVPAPGTLLGLPVIAGSSSPQQIALIDCPSIAVSYDDSIALDVSTSADVQMSDAPTQDGTAGTGSTMVSLYQNSLVAIMAEFSAAWQSSHFNAGSPTQSSSVAYMTVSY